MRTQYLSYFTGFRPGCQAISQRFETFETDSPPSNVPSPHIPRSMVGTSNPLVGDGLACPAQGNGAIPAHFGVMGQISHWNTDCHTSDIGHWFAMTLFSIACQKSVGFHCPIRCSSKPSPQCNIIPCHCEPVIKLAWQSVPPAMFHLRPPSDQRLTFPIPP